MDKLFLTVLNMSFTAAIIIPVVLLIRLVLKKAPKVFAYGLWAVVLFRLLCPVSFSTGFSLMEMLQTPTAENGQITYLQPETAELTETGTRKTGDGESVQENGKTIVQTENRNGEGLWNSGNNNTKNYGNLSETADMSAVDGQTKAGSNSRNLFLYVWLLGVAAMLIYSMVTLGRLKYKLKSAALLENHVYESGLVSSPFVCGIFSPRIYLPKDLGEEEKEYILLHERIHIKRGDHITRLLSYLALSIHWFNPFVWLAFFISGKDMELACDEAVLRKIGDRKKAYSASLLNLATGKKVVTGIPLAFGEGNIKGRIKNVLNYKKPAFWLMAVAVVICVSSGIFLLGNPRGEETKKAKREETTESEKDSGEESDMGNVYEETASGFIREADYNGEKVKVVSVPMGGNLLLTEAELVVSNLGEKNPIPEIGDIVEVSVTCKGDLENNYGNISNIVEGEIHKITILARGYGFEPLETGGYRLSIPIDKIEGGDKAQVGEYLKIFQVRNSFKELEQPVLSVFTKIIAKEHGTITIEAKRRMQFIFAPEMFLCSTGKLDGTYTMVLIEVDKEKRLITQFEETETNLSNHEDARDTLKLSQDCVFKANYAMDTYQYKEISYDTFVDLQEQGNRKADVTFSDSQAVEIKLRSAYESEGIFCNEKILYRKEETEYLKTFLETAKLVSTEQKDIADIPGMETIEVYTNEQEGYVISKDAKGKVLFYEDAHTTRAGWNNIYVGELEGKPFIMTASFENRWESGIYSYEIFRFDENGEIVQLAGSYFHWDISDGIPRYGKEWSDTLDFYLEKCYLLLSTQDGEIRTEKVCEADRYNYANFYKEWKEAYEEWKRANEQSESEENS